MGWRKDSGNGNYLVRTSGLLDPTQDSTYMCWFRPSTVGTSPSYNLPFYLGDDPATLYDDFVRVRVNTTNVRLEVNSTSDFVNTTTISANVWVHYAWVQEGTAQKFYVNGNLIGSVTLDRSGDTVTHDLTAGDGLTSPQSTVAYVRQWQAALTEEEIRAERQMPTALRTADLFLDTPLETDLLDVSGNGRNWTVTGTGAFISPPQTVLDTITGDTWSRVVTQAEFNANNDAWFLLELDAPKVISVNVTFGGTFTQARVQLIYLIAGTTTTTAPVATAIFSDVDMTSSVGGWGYYLRQGRYYIRIRKTAGGTTNFDFTVNYEATAAIDTAVTPGALLINDDSNPGTAAPVPGRAFPATVIEFGSGFSNFRTNVPAGEIGDGLPSGVSLWQDRFNRLHATDQLALFDEDHNYVMSIPGTSGFGTFSLIANDFTKFYALNFSTYHVHTVLADGTLSASIADLSSTDARALGVNRAGTILYYAEGYNNGTIFRWEIGVGAMAPLYTIPGFVSGQDYLAQSAVNTNPGELLVQADDTLVTIYYDESSDTTYILHIDSDGTLINQWSTGDHYANHIHYAMGAHPRYVNLWLYKDKNFEQARFVKFDLQTGTSADVTDIAHFSALENLWDTANYGPSSSCTFITSKYGLEQSEGDPPPVDDGGEDRSEYECGEQSVDPGTIPDPIGTLPAWTASCIGGGQPGTVADLPSGEVF